MSDAQSSADSSAAPVGQSRGSEDTSVLFVLGAVLATTLFLALNSTLIHRRTTELTRETAEVIAPALRASQSLIVSVSLEHEALMRYTLAEDTSARHDHRRYAVERAAAMDALTPLLEQVRGEPLAHGRRLRREDERWRALAAELVEPPEANAAEWQEAADVYRAMLVAATAVEESLRSSLELAWRRLNEAERLDWYYTLGHVGVALAAAIYIARLMRRVRLLAREAEQRRQEAVDALEDRSRMIRGITHDVKNPLGVADASAQLLQLGLQGALTEPQQTSVARIRRGIGGALAIVEDLLELSRAEAGILSIEAAPADVRQLLSAVADDHRAEAAGRNILLELRLAGDVPRIVTDAERVRQIVGNLLSNAFKYTRDGGHVALGAQIDAVDGAMARWLTVFVTDDGPGIDPAEHERIFEEFYRTETAQRRAAGAGVGLAISRRIARLLGGDLSVESVPGRFTTFSLSLPLDGVPSPRAAGRREAAGARVPPDGRLTG